MYENLRGKKLLFLGAVRPLCEPVRIAKAMGIHTVVIDYYPDSPAKAEADEAYLLSTTDTDAVVSFCREHKIDGLFTAYIDSMLPYARKICDIMGWPFYASEEQIKLSLDKGFFKECCRRYHVPCADDYSGIIREKGFGAEEIHYPVVVKPADSSGARGVKSCGNAGEAEAAYNAAMTISPGGKVLVEEYLTGDEFLATYTMKDGEVSLSSVTDTFLTPEYSGASGLFDGSIIPSGHLNNYITQIDPYIRAMLNGMKATDGCVFFQGKINGGSMKLFECGYRPNGTYNFRQIEAENGINYIRMMLAHALTGVMDGYELSMDNPFFGSFYYSLSVLAHGGTISIMEGAEEAAGLPGVISSVYLHRIGDKIIDAGTLSQRVYRAVIKSDSIAEIQSTIKKIQSIIRIEDENGKNMLFEPFDIHRLDGYGRRQK